MSHLERVPPNPVDVAVIGAGPAGVVLSPALGERGCSVVCIAPDPVTRWTPRYGAWADELDPFDLQATVERVYSTARMTTSAGTHRVDSGYVRFNTEKLQIYLQSEATREGVMWWAAEIDTLRPEGFESVLTSTRGEEIRARLVVDATGSARRFVQTHGGPPPAYQTAYGELIVSPGHPFPMDEAVVMDYGHPHEDTRVPTFLYALPIDADTVLVEETSLVASEPLSLEKLKTRLTKRLQSLGVERQEVLEVEYCRIPMGAPLPHIKQRVFAFGVAASRKYLPGHREKRPSTRVWVVTRSGGMSYSAMSRRTRTSTANICPWLGGRLAKLPIKAMVMAGGTRSG